MRADVVSVTRRALSRGRRVFILVNNKAEGSSPLTVMGLARRLAEEGEGRVGVGSGSREESGVGSRESGVGRRPQAPSLKT